MALFGAPLNTPDQARRAIESALEMRMALNELNRELLAGTGRVLRFGVGIHTATVVAGNIGSPQRYNYTVIGDGVNVASRLQALTRFPVYDADIIVSDATLSETFSMFRSRQLGDVAVKGKQQLVGIHALLGRRERKEGAP
jgi:adenylate cyclase